MATYKVEVVSRLGKFHSALWDAKEGKADPLQNKPFDTIEDLVGSLSEQIDKQGLDEEQDSIIWRQIAYDDYEQLKREMRLATY